MKPLKSFVRDAWHEPDADLEPIYNPCTEEPVATVSTTGIDFRKTVEHSRDRGGRALRELTFAERGALLEGVCKALHEAREELIDVSLENSGTTRKDAKFDVDGATFVLQYYADRARTLGNGRVLTDGEGTALGRSARYWGQHARVPLRGTAVLINAFNFPLWGFAEKAAAALLAGMPVIVKPAQSTALVTARGVERIIEGCSLPEGALSFVCGPVGDLLSGLGSQDVVAFTGSAATGYRIRSSEHLLRSGTRVNVEADSLNAAVLGPDVQSGTETWSLFVKDVVREITQKTGQKCTAVRRILVPEDRRDAVEEVLVDRLGAVVTGNPLDASVTMGPLATAPQLEDTVAGMKELLNETTLILGASERIDGVGAEPGRGYFFGPGLLRANDAAGASAVHEREVFGPVATVLSYDGSAEAAGDLVARGGGSLVTSVYSDDTAWVERFMHAGGGAYNGRLYLGSEKMAAQAFGSGAAMPQSLHGGPGRAGGGEELGDLRALNLYTQRLALQGGRRMIESLLGDRES